MFYNNDDNNNNMPLQLKTEYLNMSFGLTLSL